MRIMTRTVRTLRTCWACSTRGATPARSPTAAGRGVWTLGRPMSGVANERHHKVRGRSDIYRHAHADFDAL